MATVITNDGMITIAQKSTALFGGMIDNLKGVTVQFETGANKGDTVKVGVVSAGANSTEATYETDGGTSIVFKNIEVSTISKQQFETNEASYNRIQGVLSQGAYDRLVSKAGKAVSDAVYGLINTTNFPLSANKIATGVAETALTVDNIYAAVGSAIATGLFDPNNIKVVAPWVTYARLRSEMDKRFSQGISMNFELIPNTVTSVTYITDGSAAGLAMAGDPGSDKTAMVDPDGQIGYSLKVFKDDRKDSIVIAPRFVYGVALLGGPIRWLQSA